MELLIGVLIGVTLTQFSLLWYKVGKVERGLKDLKNNVKEMNNGSGIHSTQD